MELNQPQMKCRRQAERIIVSKSGMETFPWFYYAEAPRSTLRRAFFFPFFPRLMQLRSGRLQVCRVCRRLAVGTGTARREMAGMRREAYKEGNFYLHHMMLPGSLQLSVYLYKGDLHGCIFTGRHLETKVAVAL